ncbi:Cell division protein DamX [Vibrio stylophorae]|uniref:Cell division protein DamX n=1 Tax=Vibrio stylophorae TaxID=659351 RepID=A0ABM8ZW71_9VIBR|nr:AAA family ATPase [Vibrio stylophorae]CAH0534588.1 Cell division protein DamX [Vibrio stylophorae]
MSHPLALELDSQTQLLSRLQFLTRFGSNFIHVTGPQGAGKTWLAEQFLAQWCDDANQALLACYANQSAAQQRVMLLKQLFSEPLFNEDDPLIDSFERMQGERPCRLVLLVDDADLLSAEILAELWAVVMRAQQQEAWQINVLLFSQPKSLNNALRQLSHGQGVSPVDIDISPLNDTEVELFSDMLKARYAMNANARRQMQQSIKQIAPWPGALLALMAQKTPAEVEEKKRAFSPLSLLILLLTLVSAGAVWWFIPSSDDAKPAPVDVKTVVESAAEIPARPEKAQEKQPNSPPAEDNFKADEIRQDGLTVGRKDEPSQRVVVPSEVVDNLVAGQVIGAQNADEIKEVATQINNVAAKVNSDLKSDDVALKTQDKAAVSDVAQTQPQQTEKHEAKEKPAVDTAAKAVSEEVTEVAKVIAQATDATPEQMPQAAVEGASAKPVVKSAVQAEVKPQTEAKVETETQAQPKANAQTETVVAATESAKPHPLLNASKLLARPAQHYALQFAAIKTEAEMNAFLAKHPQLTDLDLIGYRSMRGDQPWYLLVYGDFASVSAARRAEMALPDDLKSLEPWVKSYRQIHAEINSGN